MGVNWALTGACAVMQRLVIYKCKKEERILPWCIPQTINLSKSNELSCFTSICLQIVFSIQLESTFDNIALNFTMADKPNHERTMEEKIKYFKSAPFDARFVQTNQARNCFQNYIDYHRCNSVMDAKGKDNHVCTFFKLCYNDLCPDSWVEKWNDQVEEGTFPAKINL